MVLRSVPWRRSTSIRRLRSRIHHGEGGLDRLELRIVPLADAVVSPKDVRVAVDKKLAKDAPSIETDGQLDWPHWNPLCLSTTGLSTLQGASGERRLGRR